MRMLPPLAVIALLSACGSPEPSSTALPANFALDTTAIALPPEPAILPPEAALVTQNCTACHSPEMILSQPPLDDKKWQAEIDKMRTVFKASVDPAQDRQLIAELRALQRGR